MGGRAGDWVYVYLTVGRFPATQFQRVAFQNPAIHTRITGGSRVVVGDFDADGLDDLYFTRGSGASFVVGLSQGTGAFTTVPMAASSFIAWSWSFYATPVVGDFNGDGASDVALVGGRGWTSIPVAFSTRRTDVSSWIVHNSAVPDFPVFAAQTGALAAADDPTNTVDTVAPPPPTPDPPSSMPVWTDAYVQDRYIDMPENQPTVFSNATWVFEFNVCNDNYDDYPLGIPYVLVRETYVGVGNQWHVNAWWAKGLEVKSDGSWSQYRTVTYLFDDTGIPPFNDNSRPPYRLEEIPARDCRRMFFDVPGGHATGIYQFDVHVGEAEPLSGDEESYATIVVVCPPSFDLACSVQRL
jgi:hypothetical protein